MKCTSTRGPAKAATSQDANSFATFILFFDVIFVKNERLWINSGLSAQCIRHVIAKTSQTLKLFGGCRSGLRPSGKIDVLKGVNAKPDGQRKIRRNPVGLRLMSD
jgi:hypothetical protein